MSDSQAVPNARRFRAPKAMADSPCQHCFHPLGFGGEVAICEACSFQHHAVCWEERGGCAKKDCINAPFKILPPELTATAGTKCRRCGAAKLHLETYCSSCYRDEDGVFHGERMLVPQAKKALTQAIIGIFLFGMVLGPLAISNARQAKQTIDSDPSFYKGRGMANSAIVIGALTLILWVLGLISRLIE